MGDINYITPEEFREEGYLQEVNRRFLHPLGLAIEMVSSGPNEPQTSYAIVAVSDLEYLKLLLQDKDASEDGTALIERIDRAIEGSGRAIFSGVWDYRDDPEGIRFGGDDWEPDEEFVRKAQHIQDIWTVRRRERASRLGYNVQPYADHYAELGSDIVKLYGRALGEVMSQIIPVKAESKDWEKAARTILNRICEIFAGEPYNPSQVTPEEVHLVDLILGAEGFSGLFSRAEAANMLVDKMREANSLADFYKGVFDQASADLARIRSGDIPPGMSPQDFADQALANLAGDLGG